MHIRPLKHFGSGLKKLCAKLSTGAALAVVSGACAVAADARGVDILDPTPMTQQAGEFSGAVDEFNMSFGVLGGSLDGVGNGMAITSIAFPMPFVSSFGVQGDLAYGLYDGNSAEASAAAALHIFWRNPGVGMLGIYGDWGYISPVHAGRLGMEGSYYSGDWTVDVFAGMEFGQNVYTKFVDEVDLSYYVDDNTKVSIGHRFISRGNVANIGFEKQFDWAGQNLSLFGEAEFGEDDYYSAFVGIKAAFGGASTLKARDRNSGVRVRIPRNLASITQCGTVDNPFAAPNWLTDLHLITPGSMTETLCASKKSINRVSTTGPYKP